MALAVQRGHSTIVNVLRGLLLTVVFSSYFSLGSRKYTADDFVEAARRGELGDIEAMISWGMAIDIQNVIYLACRCITTLDRDMACLLLHLRSINPTSMSRAIYWRMVQIQTARR